MASKKKKPSKRPPAPKMRVREPSLSAQRTSLSKARKRAKSGPSRAAIERELSKVVQAIAKRAKARRNRAIAKAVHNMTAHFPEASEKAVRRRLSKATFKVLTKAGTASRKQLLHYAQESIGDEEDYGVYNPFWYHD